MRSAVFPLPLALALLGASQAPAQDASPATVQAQLRWSDVDGDGLEDAIALAPTGELALLLNRGDGSFDEATLAAGLADYRGVELVLCADFDGDGLTDLYLGSSSGQQKLLRNLGRLAFEPARTGIDHVAPELSATALDYDHDGLIDLHVSTQSGDLLYHNLGDARFQRAELPLAAGPLLPLLAVPNSAAPATEEVDSPRPGRSSGASASATAKTAGAFTGSRVADFGDASAAPGGTGSLPLFVSCGLAAAAAANVVDQATGTTCIQASSVPTIDMLYPISQELFVQAGTGRVGMGTTSPGATLDVQSPTGSGSFNLAGPGGTLQTLREGSEGWDIYASTNDYAIGRHNIDFPFIIDYSTGNTRVTKNLGVGAAMATYPLEVVTPIEGASFQVFDFAAGGGNDRLVAGFNGNGAGPQVRLDGALPGSFIDLAEDADGSFVIETSDTPRLTVTQTGNVGIGAGVPITKLQVDGGGDAGLDTDGFLVLGNAASFNLVLDDNEIIARENGATDTLYLNEPGGDVVLCASGGNVGIGTGFTDPSYKLAVAGDGQTDNVSMDGNLIIKTSGPNGGKIRFKTTGAFDWDVQGDTNWSVSRFGVDFPFFIDGTTGNVGVKTTSPTFDLEVNGTAGKPGGGSWSVSSDARLKRNVRELDGALETLLALRGVSFEYKDPESINELAGERIGFIATDVEAVLPDWVEEIDGYKRLTVRGFEALAVEGLRELQSENEALRARVERLEGIEAELAGMRATMAQLMESR